VLNRKLLREVRSSGSLLLAITSIIAVGVMCFVYMRSSYFNLNLAQSRYYAQCRMADFWVELKKAPVAELEAVAALAGVTGIHPRIQFYATVDLERVEKPLNGLVLSLPDRRRPIINDVVLKRGGYFTDRRDNEVIVNDAFARHHGIFPGQWIHLILNNRRQELLVVGTAISSEFVYLVGPGALSPDPEHFGVFYLKRTYAEEVFDFAGAANQLVGHLAPTHQLQPEDVLRRIETVLQPFGVFTTFPRRNQLSHRFLSDEIRGLGVFATILPGIFMAVAALVLNVLMVRLIEQQRVIIGTFKALGYTDSQIFWHFARFGLILGFVGGLVGLGLGYAMAEFVTRLYRQFFEFPQLVNQVYPGTYLAGLGVSLACALVGSIHGARTALRLSPAEAMRPRPPARGGAIWLERWTWLWRRLGFRWRLVLRNLFRNRLRSAVGVFAAAMGAGLLVTGFILTHAVVYMISFQFEMVTRSDMDLVLADDGPRSAWDEARRLPGVDYAEPTFDLACTFVNGHHRRRGAITGLAPGALLTIPRDLEGQPLRVPAHGVCMTRKLADLLALAPGDNVTILPVKGRRDPFRVPVVEISDSYVGLSVYTDIHYLSRLAGEELTVSGVQLLLDPRPEPRAALYRALKQLPALRSVNARADVIRNLIETVVETQKIFIGLMVIFAGVMFFGSLLNSSLISLAERQREVATLRVLGYSSWEVGGLFLRESMLINALGTLLGLPLGYLLAYVLSVVYDTEMFRFPLVTPPEVWFKTILGALVFALAAHAIVQRDIHRLDWLDASKTKE
jgi:putative ABC transport system permease protein